MNGQRLLVLDDDHLIGKTIRYIAQSCGFETHYEVDGAGFLAAVEHWQPSHIVLDLVMPGLDGVQVIERLAERQCSARLIIASGLDARVLEAASRNAQELGLRIAGILSKPFSAETLRAMLRADGEQPGEGTCAVTVAPLPALAMAEVNEPELAEDLADAIAEGDLSVAFQPKIRCRDGRLAGFEVLVRWQHPVRGSVGPGVFVPLAERVGLVDALTECVLERSLPWFAGVVLELADRPDLVIEEGLQLSVNLSARSLIDMTLVDRIFERCQRHRVAANQLLFELTETAAMEDPVGSLGLLTRLRMKGFQLSIDDFGTGFSSMLQLVRLPFSEVKVDRSFVSSVPTSHESQAVVRSVVDLGHSLGMQVTAEGIEDEATLAFLYEIGCDLAQGYLISRPLAPDQVRPWIAARWPVPAPALSAVA